MRRAVVIRHWLLPLALAVPFVSAVGIGTAAAASTTSPAHPACTAAGSAPAGPAARPAGRAAAAPGRAPARAPGRAGGAVANFAAPAALPPVTVWLAGDSTVANPSGGVCPVGWGSQFDPLFTGGVTVLNRAVAGRSIQTWLYDPNVTGTKDATGECVISPQTFSSRWQAMLAAGSGMKSGDYLFIQFGINDGDPACPRHVGSARYQQLLGMMAQAARQRGANPVFVTPAAAIACSGSRAVGNRGFVTETKAAGAAQNVPVIDLHQLSVNLYNQLGLCPNNGDFTAGPVGAFFCNDHTHFETAGARQIAAVMATALRSQGIPLAGYLR